MTPGTKTGLWHAGRLALAATLLAIDQRLFLFYGFTLLLMLIHQVDRLRAIVRVIQIRNDTAIRLLLKDRGIMDSDVEAEWASRYDALDPKQRSFIDDDARRALLGELI